MITKILIIGGYGNFGSLISKALAQQKNMQLLIAGRNINKAKQFIESLESANQPLAIYLDIFRNLDKVLHEQQPDIVIHTSGPFQSQSYEVAYSCIKYQCHYIDLADSKKFVTNIHQLDTAAQKNNILICTGASSVPTLTSAIIDNYMHEFATLETIDYGITTAQLTNNGLATTAAVLSYAGKPFKTLVDGEMTKVYGCLGLHLKKIKGLKIRLLGFCDIPDLQIFPNRYPSLKNIYFRAGIELKFMQFILACLSYLVKLKLIKSLQPYASKLLKISKWFDKLGTDDSGFYMHMSGLDQNNQAKKLLFEIIAKHGDGLNIPTIPAILMAKKLADKKSTIAGAKPCMDMITLEEYLQAMKDLNIQWRLTEVN